MNVIIFGCSHHNTLGVIRSLGEKGIPTILILVEDKGYSFVGKSKYLKEVLFVHDENEGIRIIQNWGVLQVSMEWLFLLLMEFLLN